MTGLAGCSDVFGGLNLNSSNESTPTPTSDQPTSTPEATDTEYTRVYRDTISSVVQLSVTNAAGQDGQGSGFLFRDRHIITNAHVVSDMNEVHVRFSKGEWRSASITGVDPSSDLAVVTVQQLPDYPTPLSLRSDQPPVGTEVVAIGTPFGLEGSMTAGLVSGVDRLIPAPNDYTIPDAIQTSAPVNPGNSGGPLMDLAGQVVGVVSSGGGDNLAFAISAALIERVVPALIENGTYDHAALGVTVQSVTPEIAQQLGLDQPQGVVIRSVQSSAADVLQQEDVIVRVEDTPINSRQELASFLALKTTPGDTIQITVIRDGTRQTVSVTLGTRSNRNNPNF
ncbi:trypsin-like peptidase domain-containing protein (plasmid) [Halocatena salina]|uniref:Trypsin-like peptidase domain-containing protein n=2 Tax=Halocatena salina TaxID=2934340 RepID=A0A8U0A5Y6_9EURY|nr:trypsin-like peptidase domain-containing protein [Halocatena salina]UPM44585.1 trypsin-like peptidase domain-containing protein [Halocatena salina]